MTDTTVSAATAARLGTLRIRVTALIALLLTLVAAVLAVVVIRIDADLRDEQIDAELLRRVDEISRQVDFVDGEVQPDDPSGLLEEDAAMVVAPDFDVLDLVDAGLGVELPEPDGTDMAFWIAETFEDLDDDQRAAVAGDLYEEGFDDDEVLEILQDEPPELLWEEAYRRFLFFEAEERGIDLALGARQVFVADDALGDAEVLVGAVDRVIEDEEDGRFEVETSTGLLYARGTPLLDGLEIRGAMAAFVEAAAFDDAHASLRNRVILVAGGLVLLGVVASWFVAGRSIRPVAGALAQQERFIADAAHELRTPIAAIRSTAEAAGDDALVRVTALAEDASTLTDDLMTLARMDADRLPLETEPVRLDLLVESLIDGDPAFVEHLDESVVDIDPGLVSRAVDNLLRNAIAHGGASADRPATVRVSAGVVTVADRGDGIDPAELERVFDRFHSRSGSRGHGLGLPLTRWIARAHGGDVTASSESGAVFRLDLGSRRRG
ncbi:MAG: HAMP domain-containing sensor histidine kinase [Actinomycetota bacterium]